MQTMSRFALLFFFVLGSGCGGDTGFQPGTQDPDTEEGTGVAEVYPTELLFEDCVVGIAYSQPFKITNVGENTLQVYEVGVVEGGAVFYLEDVGEFSLEPKAPAREFMLVATLPTADAAKGTVRIKTSDSDALNFSLPAQALPSTDTGDTGDSAVD